MEFIIILLFILVFGTIISMLHMRKKTVKDLEELNRVIELINHKYNNLNMQICELVDRFEALEKEK